MLHITAVIVHSCIVSGIKSFIPASEEIHATKILIEHQRAIPLQGRESRLQSTHYSRIGFILTYSFSICGKLPFDIYCLRNC